MSKHFIENIEIKNFKCFENFKAEGFGRVNLIGGKNNVGKTAFIEACHLSKAKSVQELYSRLLEVDTHRNIINNLLYQRDKQQDIQKLIQENNNFEISQTSVRIIDYEYEITLPNSCIKYDYSKLSNILDINFLQLKSYYSTNFIAQDTSPDWLLNQLIGKAKLEDSYHILNTFLKNTFNIDNIDIIDNIPFLKKNKKYTPLSQYGQGIKSFIDIVIALLLTKEDTLFIDEIENGIHYTNLDKLWEIILTISQEQNVQVFATTHSKECIESYARVAKKLEETDIKFLSLYRNKENVLKSITFDYEKIQDRIELGLDNR